MRTAVVLALVVATSSVARADEKSPGVALGLSVGATAGGFLLLGAAVLDESGPEQIIPGAIVLFTGPSWGHVYTGDLDLAIGGTLLRGVGLAMMMEGMGKCEYSDDPYAGLDDPCEYSYSNKALATAGFVLLAGTALAEIIDAPLAAQRHNRDQKRITVTPTVDKGGRYGVTLVGTF